MRVLVNRLNMETLLKETFPGIEVTKSCLEKEMTIKEQYDAVILETTNLLPIVFYDSAKVKRQPLLFLYKDEFENAKESIIDTLIKYADKINQEYVQNIDDPVLGMEE